MKKEYVENLKSWLNNGNKRQRIENDGCACWTLVFNELPLFEGKRPRASFIFTRYQGNQTNKTIIANGNNQVIGQVTALPSYWLEVDPLLFVSYIEALVDEFLEKNFADYINGGGSGSGGTGVDPCVSCTRNCGYRGTGYCPKSTGNPPPGPPPVMTAPKPISFGTGVVVPGPAIPMSPDPIITEFNKP